MTIPFLPRFFPLILSGQKTCTARTKKYGDPGDVLDTAVGRIRIVSVTRATLAKVRDDYWREEGCTSPQAFMDVWREIHPLAGFNGARRVWLHIFEMAKP